MKVDRTVEKYLKQLLALGLFGLIAGLICSYIIYSSTSEIPLVYIPLIYFGAGIGYLLVTRGDPGGIVNYYLKPHKKTEDEKTLYDLVAKHRSETLISLVSLSFVIVVTILEIYNHASKNVFSIDIVVGLPIFAFASVLGLGTGVKYISSWWNIRRSV